MDPDERPEQELDSVKAIPVAEFEGEFIRNFEAKLPGITLDMPEGYLRGTHLVLEVETRVRSFGINEDKRGDLTRQHVLALEEVRLKEAFDPAARPNNVGGNLAGQHPLGAWVDEFVDWAAGGHDELDFEGEDVPDRLRDMLKIYFERIQPPSMANPTPVESDHPDMEVGF